MTLKAVIISNVMAPTLRKVEKDVLIPRYLEYKITRELCSEQAKKFAECSKAAGLRVIFDCKSIRKEFEDCSNRWWNDEGLRKEVTDEYLAKRKRFRETGEAERSPFARI